MQLQVGQHVYLFDDQTSGTYEWPDRPGVQYPHHNSESDYTVWTIDGEGVILIRWNGEKYRTSMTQLAAVVLPEQLDPVWIAHRHLRGNRRELEASGKCACVYCYRVFHPRHISKWVRGDQKTAVCPHCAVDAVLAEKAGFAFDADFLKQIHTRYFIPKELKNE